MNTLAVLYRQWSLGFPSSPVCFRCPSCFISLVAPSIEPGREYRALSDTYWSVVGLASMVTIRAVPETSGDRSLGDADESDEAYSSIMMGKEAGVLLSSLGGMVKTYKSDSCLKVQVPRPWLDKRS